MAVTNISDSTLNAALESQSKVVVKFYADWCGSCKLFAPKFKRLSNDERFTDISFLEINAEENPESRSLAKVNNLPFFATFQNGVLLASVSTSKEEALITLLDELKTR